MINTQLLFWRPIDGWRVSDSTHTTYASCQKRWRYKRLLCFMSKKTIKNLQLDLSKFIPCFIIARERVFRTILPTLKQYTPRGRIQHARSLSMTWLLSFPSPFTIVFLRWSFLPFSSSAPNLLSEYPPFCERWFCATFWTATRENTELPCNCELCVILLAKCWNICLKSCWLVQSPDFKFFFIIKRQICILIEQDGLSDHFPSFPDWISTSQTLYGLLTWRIHKIQQNPNLKPRELNPQPTCCEVQCQMSKEWVKMKIQNISIGWYIIKQSCFWFSVYQETFHRVMWAISHTHNKISF